MKNTSGTIGSLDGGCSLEATEGNVAEGAEVLREKGTEGVEEGFAAVGAGEEMVVALPAAQRVAIERLTRGDSYRAAAIAAGVSRMTLWRWMNQDAQFIAAYNTWERDVMATTRARLLALCPAAAMAVDKAMGRGDGRLALRLLEKMGFAREPRPGPTEKEEVERAAARKERRKKALERKAEVRIQQEEGNLAMEAAFAELGGVGLSGGKKKRG